MSNAYNITETCIWCGHNRLEHDPAAAAVRIIAKLRGDRSKYVNDHRTFVAQIGGLFGWRTDLADSGGLDECGPTLIEEIKKLQSPIPMLLACPTCGERHIDEGEFATKPHHTHACQTCGMVWRPALCATVGVQFLPGFKNEGSK